MYVLGVAVFQFPLSMLYRVICSEEFPALFDHRSGEDFRLLPFSCLVHSNFIHYRILASKVRNNSRDLKEKVKKKDLNQALHLVCCHILISFKKSLRLDSVSAFNTYLRIELLRLLHDVRHPLNILKTQNYKLLKWPRYIALHECARILCQWVYSSYKNASPDCVS